MYNKRGISPLIATVLVIGMTMVLAAFVSNYVIKQTKQFDIEKMSGAAEEFCNEVNLQIIPYDENPNNEAPPTIICETIQGSQGVCGGNVPSKVVRNIAIKNKGAFTIRRVTVNAPGLDPYVLDEDYLGPEGIKPGADARSIGNGLAFCSGTGNKISLVPAVKNQETGEIVDCTSKTALFIPEGGSCN